MQLPQNLQIRGVYGIIYTDYSYLPRSNRKTSLLENFKSKATYSGRVTDSAAKRIRKAVSIFVQRSEKQTIFNSVTGKYQNFKVSFLTLTIPNLTSKDNSFYYKHLLKPFLRILKDKFQVRDYIWKAELQKRGSIHYHLTLNTFIPYTFLRDQWNILLQRNNLMSDFIEKYGHVSPNSIDIHSVKDVSNLEAYLCKYISKSTQNEVSLKGKVWGCSEELSKAKYFSKVIADGLADVMNSLVCDGKIVIKHLENFSIVKFVGNVNWWLFGKVFVNEYNSWRSNRLVLRL